MEIDSSHHYEAFLKALSIEASAVSELKKKIPAELNQIVEAIIACKGKLVVTGMGKSGIIGRKIAATLASTGTPSFFVHPAEAYHGDLGMISKSDIVLAISNSGETEEVLQLISFLEHQGNMLISMTSHPESTLGRHSRFHFDVSGPAEACPLQLAPTASTTATLAAGDALAVTLMEARKFSPEEFAIFHPGGSLGRKLLTTVNMVMRKDHLPFVDEEQSLINVVGQMSEGRLGLAIVVNAQEQLVGIITDGDLRRTMESQRHAFFELTAAQVMTQKPRVIESGAKLTEAEHVMAEQKINSLLVVEKQQVVGVVQIYDL